MGVQNDRYHLLGVFKAHCCPPGLSIFTLFPLIFPGFSGFPASMPFVIFTVRISLIVPSLRARFFWTLFGIVHMPF